MESKSLGSRLRQLFGGRGGDAAGGPHVGMHVTTLDGAELGTIAKVWRGADATDNAKHEDTLGIQPAQETKGLLYVPSTSVGKISGENLALTVDLAQVTARGWQYRPNWLPKDAPGSTAPAGSN